MYTALAHLFRATFLAVLFIISNRATRGKANPCLKTFLGCLLAVLFLVPLNIPIMQVELPANTENSFIAEKEQGTEVSPAPPDEITPGGEQPGAANASKNFLSAKAAVWAVYTLGAGITLFCTVYRYRKEVKSLLRCGRAPSAGENEIYLRLCQKHGLRKAPVLLVCPPFVIGSSLTFGIFRPTVIISEKFPPKDYALILEHELTHCKRRDSLKKALLALVSVFYWFNPIMHAFVCEMNGLCEEACDETLLKNSGEEQREAYCLLLIQTALSKSAEKKFIFSAFSFCGANSMSVMT
jgi:beta-lactamase regulating signal transducer with metallopeptidase domain